MTSAEFGKIKECSPGRFFRATQPILFVFRRFHHRFLSTLVTQKPQSRIKTIADFEVSIKLSRAYWSILIAHRTHEIACQVNPRLHPSMNENLLFFQDKSIHWDECLSIHESVYISRPHQLVRLLASELALFAQHQWNLGSLD